MVYGYGIEYLYREPNTHIIYPMCMVVFFSHQLCFLLFYNAVSLVFEFIYPFAAITSSGLTTSSHILFLCKASKLAYIAAIHLRSLKACFRFVGLDSLVAEREKTFFLLEIPFIAKVSIPLLVFYTCI